MVRTPKIQIDIIDVTNYPIISRSSANRRTDTAVYLRYCTQKDNAGQVLGKKRDEGTIKNKITRHIKI